MTNLQVKEALKKLWNAKFIIAGTMIVTCILDLIMPGLGFIVGFSFLFIYGIIALIKAK
jgi:hypothetical protein